MIDWQNERSSTLAAIFFVTPEMTTSYAHQRRHLFFAKCENTLTTMAGAGGWPELVFLQQVTSTPVSHRLP